MNDRKQQLKVIVSMAVIPFEFLQHFQTQLNSTQIYLKAVAERLKKIQCSAMDNQF